MVVEKYNKRKNMDLEKSIILEYDVPASVLLKHAFGYGFFIVGVLVVLFTIIFEIKKYGACDCAQVVSIAFVVLIFWLINGMLISMYKMPGYTNVKKYTKLVIEGKNIYINEEQYDISDLDFKISSRTLPNYFLSWTDLLLYKKDKLVGKFILSMNTYNFFGMSSNVIIKVLESLKNNPTIDYIKLTFNERLEDNLEEKEVSKNFFIVGLFLLIPISAIVLVMLLNI